MHTWRIPEPAGLNLVHSGHTSPNRPQQRRRLTTPNHELKALGTYRVPFWGGWNLSSVFRRQSGSTWSRAVVVRNLSQGQELIRAEPRGSRRLPTVTTIDMRVEKMLAADRSAGFAGSIYVEAFNLANSGVATAVVTTSGQYFGQPSSWTNPRTVFVGIRGTF
jgi:hypothetical protein